jgi:CMP-N-acetylneuraminic acid synthetase
MPRNRSIDIDTAYDLELALWMAKTQGFAAAPAPA